MCFGFSKEPSQWDGSFETHNICFGWEIKKKKFQLPTLIWGPDNTVPPMRLEMPTPWLQVKHSTAEPLCPTYFRSVMTHASVPAHEREHLGISDNLIRLSVGLDSKLRGRRFEPHRRHCGVSLSKNINPSLVLVQPRKTRPFITERLLMGHKESNQTKTLPL